MVMSNKKVKGGGENVRKLGGSDIYNSREQGSNVKQ